MIKFNDMDAEDKSKAFLMRVAKDVLNECLEMQKYNRLNTWNIFMNWSFRSFDAAIEKHYKKVLTVSSLDNSVFFAKDIERKIKEDTRKRLADDLRNVRNKLSRLRWKSTKMEYLIDEQIKSEVIKKAVATRNEYAIRLLSAKKRLKSLEQAYSDLSLVIKADYLQKNARDKYITAIPVGHIYPSKFGDGIPSVSGIYFLWNGNVVEYVGKSINLSQRLRLGNHHIMNGNHTISYLLYDTDKLTFAECYYISLVEPCLNFGGSNKLSEAA